MIKRKNTILAALILGASLTMTGCSEADKVNYNMSKQADYFECERKITVYNARTHCFTYQYNESGKCAN